MLTLTIGFSVCGCDAVQISFETLGSRPDEFRFESPAWGFEPEKHSPRADDVFDGRDEAEIAASASSDGPYRFSSALLDPNDPVHADLARMILRLAEESRAFSMKD